MSTELVYYYRGEMGGKQMHCPKKKGPGLPYLGGTVVVPESSDFKSFKLIQQLGLKHFKCVGPWAAT